MHIEYIFELSQEYCIDSAVAKFVPSANDTKVEMALCLDDSAALGSRDSRFELRAPVLS